MMAVEELERALLEGARKELAPSASDRMRIQSRLVGNTAWFEPAPVRRSVLRGLTHSWRGGLALGFAVGALLGFGASRGVGYAFSSSSPRSEAVPVLAAAARGRTVALPEFLEPPDTVASEQSGRHGLLTSEPVLPKPASSARGRADGAGPRGAASAGSRTTAAGESGSTLAQELALLQRARRALNRSDAALALGIVQSLDERFPDGVLMEERAATRILSLCQLDRKQEARERGRRFLLAHPRSVYAERVRHSCAGGQ
ncbi:MAG: hypothetical protein ABI895_00960 [Deltaproteobacteria bacterium]